MQKIFRLRPSDWLIALFDGRVFVNIRSGKSNKSAKKKKKGITIKQYIFEPSPFDYELILVDCKPYSEAIFEDLYDYFFDSDSHWEAKYLPIKKSNKRSIAIVMAYFLQLNDNDFTSCKI